MLDKQSEQVLHYIIGKYYENPLKADNVILVSPAEFNLSCDDLNSLCENLMDEKYIYPFRPAAVKTPFDSGEAEIYITHKGLRYFEIKRIALIGKILGVAISVVIAIIEILEK